MPMNAAATALLAGAMATDAFTAAVGKGSALARPSWREALRTGAIFGVIETLTPIAGWLLGTVASRYVREWDHWIAFTLLAVLGLRMIVAGLGTPEVEEVRPDRHGFWVLAVTGFATSIDAMAVGVGLAFIEVAIVPVAIAIGTATFVLSTLGVLVGRALGTAFGRRAEVLGGVILIGIGIGILVEHLSAG